MTAVTDEALARTAGSESTPAMEQGEAINALPNQVNCHFQHCERSHVLTERMHYTTQHRDSDLQHTNTPSHPARLR